MSLTRKSSRKPGSRMLSPELQQPVARQIPCCTCWPSPTKRRSPFPSTISTASAHLFPFSRISNPEDDLSQQISTQQAALRSSQSASLKLDCFAAIASPLPDERSPKKRPLPRKPPRSRLSPTSTHPPTRPPASPSSKEISPRNAAS